MVQLIGLGGMVKSMFTEEYAARYGWSWRCWARMKPERLTRCPVRWPSTRIMGAENHPPQPAPDPRSAATTGRNRYFVDYGD